MPPQAEHPLVDAPNYKDRLATIFITKTASDIISSAVYYSLFSKRIQKDRILLTRVAPIRNLVEQPIIKEWVSLAQRFRGTFPGFLFILNTCGINPKVYRQFIHPNTNEIVWVEITGATETEQIEKYIAQGYEPTVYWRVLAIPYTVSMVWTIPCAIGEIEIADFISFLDTILTWASPIWVVWQRKYLASIVDLDRPIIAVDVV
jgi:hypothetical protein